MADALPGFGIVAAGIVITMGMLGDPNTDSAAIGGHVAAALVQAPFSVSCWPTVLFPLAQAVGQRAEEGGQALECIKACILAQQGYNPQIAVEFDAKSADRKPLFSELEEFLRGEGMSKPAPIIVKRVIKKGDGHHGGSWKVAFADFATAMMAFFFSFGS